MFNTIVWATDGSEASDKALPYARALARGPGRKLVVVHAEEVFAEQAAGYPVYADDPVCVAKIRRQVQGARAQGLDVTFEHHRGDAAQTVAQVAREAGADLILVGTRGHTPLAGFVAGSVTQRLLHISPCPVLAVPADLPADECELAGVSASAH